MSSLVIYLDNEQLDLLEELLEYAEKKAKDETKKNSFRAIKNKVKYTKRVKGKGYLDNLNEQLKEYLEYIQKEYDINIYHSFTSVIHNESKNKDNKKSKKEIYEYYKSKYKMKRPLIFVEENKLKAIYEYAYNRMENKGK